MRVPADAKAVIVAQNLVAARYVQLAPLYKRGEPQLADGATIPQERTAVPVEWDEVKTQLTSLATELGPSSDLSDTSVSRFLNSTADAMEGNGTKLRQTFAQLSQLARILSDGSGDIVATIKNLQTFVTALRDSSDELVLFGDRLATFSTVLADSRSDLDAAMKELAVAVSEVHRFIAGTRDKTSEQVARLADVTQVLSDQRLDVENILHIAPTSFANAYNIIHPNFPGAVGTFILNNVSDPLSFLCGAISGAANVTAAESGKLCAQYLGPALNSVGLNYLPLAQNPVLNSSVTPDKLIYTDPALAPDGPGPMDPPELPPAVSAYTGTGDVPPPPGFAPPLPPAAEPRNAAGTAAGAAARRGAAAGRRDATVMSTRTLVRAVATALSVACAVTSCGFGGVNSLPLPGAVASGSDGAVYHVQVANIGTLESNSPVMMDDVVVGSVGPIGVKDWHADVEVRVKRDVAVPANAVATVGQTSLLGSMHLALNPPVGVAPQGRLQPGATIGVNKASTYPSTEQTLSALSVVVNAGGLGQVGEFIHSTSTALSGRESDIRQLIGRLDTFVGTVDGQRDRFNAAVEALNRLMGTVAADKDDITDALKTIPPAMDVLLRERAQFVTALQKLGQFSDTTTDLVNRTQDDLVRNLNNLGPTLKVLADQAPKVAPTVAYLPTFPFGQNFIDRGVRGDYFNIWAQMDISVPRLKRTIFLGTRWGDPNAPLTPAPGEPNYLNYTYEPLNLGVTPAPPDGAAPGQVPGAVPAAPEPIVPVLPPPTAPQATGPGPIFAGPYSNPEGP